MSDLITHRNMRNKLKIHKLDLNKLVGRFYITRVIRKSITTGDAEVVCIDATGREYPRKDAPQFESIFTASAAAKSYLAKCKDCSSVQVQTVALVEEIVCDDIIPEKLED